MKKNINYKKIIINLFFVIIIFLSIIYITNFIAVRQEAIEESGLLNDIKISSNIDEEKEITKNDIVSENNKENVKVNKSTERMKKVKILQEQNNDIIGWIEIEDTNINYPVLQGSNNEFYLTHNYKKEKTEKGSIFLDAEYDWNIPSCNLLIYGHNIRNGQMFQDLLKYEDKDFYYNHPNIRFTTKNEDTIYEIISVFKSKVYYKYEKDVFKYYNFLNVDTEEEYIDFIKNAKKDSLYETVKNSEHKEQLITLITCSYHTEDGRFVVIGKEK